MLFTGTGEFLKLVRRFENEEELENWLERQDKDCLYDLYMKETNYEGVGYRHITRNQIKDMIREVYYRLEQMREELKK